MRHLPDRPRPRSFAALIRAHQHSRFRDEVDGSNRTHVMDLAVKGTPDEDPEVMRARTAAMMILAVQGGIVALTKQLAAEGRRTACG